MVPLFWHRSANFGDCIAPYLVEKITGLEATFVSNEDKQGHFAIVGSLLDCAPMNNTIVWGCGFVYETGLTYKPLAIHAVRGELSRARYIAAGINCPEVYGDPALLLPKFYKPEIKKQYRLGIIPHVIDYIKVLKDYANVNDEHLIIDLTQPVETVIDQILSCDKTISSSLHGLIVSHAYGIPSRWVEFSDKVLGGGFKFRDYFTTVDGNTRPLDGRGKLNLDSGINAIDFDFEIRVSLDALTKSCPLI